MEKFKVESVDLSGANIIEASAGTGKTFSIAVLVVRLLIEKSVPIQKMLLVTFTEAAAAELKERSVKFIREALLEIEAAGSSKNGIIAEVVANVLANNHNKTEIENRLRTALLNIDTAMMCTIHSFCQQTLNEFAFETNQIFGKELKTDISDFVGKHSNSFKREVLSIMDAELLQISDLLNPAILDGGIRNALSGQNLHGIELISVTASDCKEKITSLKSELQDFGNKNLESFKQKIESTTLKGIGHATRINLKNLFSTVDAALENLLNKTTHRVPELFAEEVQFCKNLQNQINELNLQIKIILLQQAIDFVLPKVKEELSTKNFFTFDDLIDKLYDARENRALKKLIRLKYDAIFVDEFQDTDKKQYAIFKALFQEDASKTMFYIGDPKQSIYAWRKADLNVYFEARNSILPEKQFTMATNFRSTNRYTTALNSFFLPQIDFDTFENGDVDDSLKIKYEAIQAFNKEEQGLSFDNQLFSPLTIIDGAKNDPDINNFIRKTICHLLQGSITLNGKSLKPSNIAVLVRAAYEGKAVKSILENEGIPSIIIDDSKVVQSQEAVDLLYILQAILETRKSTIQKALLTKLIGKKVNDLKHIDFDHCVEKFSTYQKTWQKDGIFVALNQLLNDFEIIKNFQLDRTSGHRVLSNIRQLLELLQEKEQNDSLTPNEVYSYLLNQTNSAGDAENIELSQRIESDEDAVKIVTIHKSKGLEYDVVIAPFLDLEAKVRFEFSSIRLESAGNQEYVFCRNPIADKFLETSFLKQQEQENRRLLYVALTRAKFNAIIINKPVDQYGRKSTHCFSAIMDELASKPTDLSKIEILNLEDIENWGLSPVTLDFNNVTSKEIAIPKIFFADKNHYKMSYSFLSGHPSKSIKEDESIYEGSDYNHFIFKELKKGAQIGNLLHNIFEFCDYSNSEKWKDIIHTSVQIFAAEKIDDNYFLANLYELVSHTVNTSIPIDDSGNSFYLKDIKREKRINELEFNFKIPNEFSMNTLEELVQDRAIQTKRSGDVMGMMNGLVDLFFEHNGKYYILDWKSNFLGDTVAHYENDHLSNAMNESNYHLQYLIYAVAIKKYLSSKIKNFDFDQQFGGVIYLFLRGVRAEQTSGVFFQKVTLDEVNKVEKAFNLGTTIAI